MCSAQHFTLYLGEVSSKDVSGLYGIGDEGEDIRAFEVSFVEAMKMVNDDFLDNAVSIVGLQWLDRNREKLRRSWA